MVNNIGQLRRMVDMPLNDLSDSRNEKEVSDSISYFLEKYNQTQSKITNINYTLDSILKLDEELGGCYDQTRAGDIRTEINNNLSMIAATANTIKIDLESMQLEVETKNKEDPNSPEVRIQKNHLYLLTNNFSDTIQHFSSVQTEIKNKFVRQLIRHYNIAGIPLDEENANDLLNKTDSPEMLQSNIFVLAGGTQSQEVANVYNKIASRHKDILEIESRLNDLLELFVQFSIIINDQGKQVNNISKNIQYATDYVQKGSNEIEKANEAHKGSAKCHIIIFVASFLVLVIVIIIAIFITKR